MKAYRLNKSNSTNPNYNNEVHASDCRHFYELLSYQDLGEFSSCQGALAYAKGLGYWNADGCPVCCAACHAG